MSDEPWKFSPTLLLTKKQGSQPKWPNPKYNWDLLILCTSIWAMSNTAPSRADPWWSFLLADGAHHKKLHSPTHPNHWREGMDI